MRVNIFFQAYGMNGMEWNGMEWNEPNKNIIYYIQNILYFELRVIISCPC
jgi:hypothetical protein